MDCNGQTSDTLKRPERNTWSEISCLQRTQTSEKWFKCIYDWKIVESWRRFLLPFKWCWTTWQDNNRWLCARNKKSYLGTGQGSECVHCIDQIIPNMAKQIFRDLFRKDNSWCEIYFKLSILNIYIFGDRCLLGSGLGMVLYITQGGNLGSLVNPQGWFTALMGPVQSGKWLYYIISA